MKIMKQSRLSIGAGAAPVFDEVTSQPRVMLHLETYGDMVSEQLSQSEVPRIALSDIVDTRSILGKGSFSKVYEVQVRPSTARMSGNSSSCTNSPNDTERTLCYALKCLNPKRMTSEDVFLVATADLASEISILCQLQHPNIIRLEGVASEDFAASFASSRQSSSSASSCSSSGNKRCGYFMLLEILKETLENRLGRWRKLKDSFQDHRSRRAPPLTSTELWQVIEYKNRIPNMMQGLAEGIRYLHSKRIVVRDLKPANIGFTPQGVVKLFDFGIARRVEDCKDGEIAGSLRYMAPEIMNGSRSTLTSDVYTFGVLLWEVATLNKPYADLLQTLKGHDIRAELAQKLSIQDGGQGWRSSTDEVHCAKIRALIRRCWSAHPEIRPNFDSICLELDKIFESVAFSCTMKMELSQGRTTGDKHERSLSPLMLRDRTLSSSGLFGHMSDPILSLPSPMMHRFRQTLSSSRPVRRMSDSKLSQMSNSTLSGTESPPHTFMRRLGQTVRSRPVRQMSDPALALSGFYTGPESPPSPLMRRSSRSLSGSSLISQMSDPTSVTGPLPGTNNFSSLAFGGDSQASFSTISSTDLDF
jgi:serine/threonine protein kinase